MCIIPQLVAALALNPRPAVFKPSTYFYLLISILLVSLKKCDSIREMK